MGAASSQDTDEEKAARARAIRAKIKAVAALSPSNSNHPDKMTRVEGETESTAAINEAFEGTSEGEELEAGEMEECEELCCETHSQDDSPEQSKHEEEMDEQDDSEHEETEEEEEEEDEEERNFRRRILRQNRCKIGHLEEVLRERNAEERFGSFDGDTFVKSDDEEKSEQYDDKSDKIEDSNEKGGQKKKVKEKMSRSKAIRTKIRALASLAPNLPVHRKSRSKETKKKNEERAPMERQESKRGEELLDFVKARKDRNWAEYDNECESPTKGRRTAWQFERERLEVESGVGDVTMGVRECKMCKVDTTFEGMPICRICGKGFHRQCLIKSGNYTEKQLKFVRRANTILGWSCTTCDNIFNLLTPVELDELSYEFERLDINKDGKITLEEYLAFRKAMHEREWIEPMSELDEQFERLQLKVLDADGSGFIECSEFLKRESCLKLSLRAKSELAKMLTPREVLQARQVFEKLDDNEDGFVTPAEAKHVYKSWYINLLQNIPREKLGNRSPEELFGSGEIRGSLVIKEGGHTNKDMDWNGFLQNHAIYIVSSRPNKAVAFVISKD